MMKMAVQNYYFYVKMNKSGLCSFIFIRKQIIITNQDNQNEKYVNGSYMCIGFRSWCDRV